MANVSTETLAQFYGVLLYKKKDILAIQEKLGMVLKRSGNVNKLVILPDSELMGKTLADSYELLLELVGNLISIQENLNIDGNPVLEVKYQSNKASTNISLKEFNLLMYLEELHIVDHTNKEIAEEADKNARSYLQKFEKFYGPLEDV